MTGESPDPRIALEFVRAERDALQAQLDSIRGMEPGDEYLRCEDCGLAFSIETTAAGERCSTCNGELMVIRAVQVGRGDDLRRLLGGDVGEHDAREQIVGRTITGVEHEYREDGETLTVQFGDVVLVIEADHVNAGCVMYTMLDARSWYIAQTVLALQRSNPTAPDGLPFFKTASAGDRDVPTVMERFGQRPAISVDTYGTTYSMTYRALPWWHWRSLLRRVRFGGGWAEFAEGFRH